MALTFPTNPSVGDTYQSWQWDGQMWVGGRGTLSVGEYYEVNNMPMVNITANVMTNVAQMTLPAGDWDVTCQLVFTPSAGTSWNLYQIGLSLTSATWSNDNRFYHSLSGSLGVGASQTSPWSGGPKRFNFTVATTVYAVALVNFSGGTLVAGGFIRARRAAGIVSPTINAPVSGSFTGTLTGVSPAVTGPVYWSRTGSIVTLNGGMSGQSNSADLSMTGLPVDLMPAQPVSLLINVLDATVGWVVGAAAIPAAGDPLPRIDFRRGYIAGNALNAAASGQFNTTGAKGFGGVLTWSLQ
jgi:hypothetical protein